MKSLYSIMIFVICLAPIAHSQVDTLEAIEVRSMQVPLGITEIYAQDLNGDNLKEVILCTWDHIYVYSHEDSVPIWTSPEIRKPTDLQFADFNGDSLQDISVKDSLNISIYNIFDSELIDSTAAGNLYRCYTIGDANNDGDVDIAIVSQEPYDSGSRPDSVWIKLRFGPDFSSQANFCITMANGEWSMPDFSGADLQRAEKILITSLGSNTAPEPRIIISSSYNGNTANHHISGVHYFQKGGLWVINPQNYTTIYHTDFGSNSYLEPINMNQQAYLYSLMYYKTYTLYTPYPPSYSHKLLAGCFGANQLVDTTRIMYDHSDTIAVDSIPGWTSLFGEIVPAYQGPELCYSYRDSLMEYSIQNRSIFARLSRPADSIAYRGIYNSSLFVSPEILIKEILPSRQYLFINGFTQRLNAVLPYVFANIAQISDLNNDGNDEILSISGNTLHIYNLEWATPVAERPVLPSEYLTVSNYPNPFNGQTIIKYNLPKQSDIALEIYDILGRKMESIEKPGQPAGLGQITWDALGEPSGVYFYRLSAGNEQKTGRMVLLK